MMNEKTPTVSVRIVVTVTYLLMLTLNALANALPLGGKNTGEISDGYPNLFAPAGVTFSIWGLIYLLLGLYVLYQLGILKGGARDGNKRLLTRIGILFAVSSLANSAWIFAWHYEKMPLSLVFMGVILLCLLFINKDTKKAVLNLREKFFIRLPFSIYFGWITVATIANVTIFLVSIGWEGFGISETFWMVLILFVGAAIGILTMFSQKDMAYGLVFLWAYGGILLKHVSEEGFQRAYPLIILSVGVCLFLFVMAEGYLFFAKKKDS